MLRQAKLYHSILATLKIIVCKNKLAFKTAHKIYLLYGENCYCLRGAGHVPNNLPPELKLENQKLLQKLFRTITTLFWHRCYTLRNTLFGK
jgi:hypothetical protein